MSKKLLVSVLFFCLVCGTPGLVKGSDDPSGTLNQAAEPKPEERGSVALPPLPLPDERQPAKADKSKTLEHVKQQLKSGIHFVGDQVAKGVRELHNATHAAIGFLRKKFTPTTTTTPTTTAIETTTATATTTEGRED
ncbi:hypothetical protein CSUI_002568 [Cystoisospora suis]|uniref:Transmembrane protein n=1 Tax=Cystoisospora suis TaxID=483139 RepID=A0A2C6L488_9APIC|nr:hypothetical protein CSUI_002568 [Cystoisospora suis]